MGKYRNISGVERAVAYGRTDVPAGGGWVDRDGVIVVDDSVDVSYDCQPTIWEKVAVAAAPAPAPATPAESSPPAAQIPPA